MSVTYAGISLKQRVPREFNVTRDARGHWIADEVHGLIGGIFITRKDAVRFALDEVEGDSSRVHVEPAPDPTRH